MIGDDTILRSILEHLKPKAVNDASRRTLGSMCLYEAVNLAINHISLSAIAVLLDFIVAVVHAGPIDAFSKTGDQRVRQTY
jgi:hypothetical protein